MVHHSKLAQAINRYIKDEILPKVDAGSVKHLAMYAVGALITKRVQTLTAFLDSIPMFKLAQVVNGENIDADLAVEIMCDYMLEYDHFSIKMPSLMPGTETTLTLRKTDIEIIDRYIKS